MQPIGQQTQMRSSLELRLLQYEREIHSLTIHISMHQREKTNEFDTPAICSIYRQRIHEWRRFSFMLHRKRSELKKARDLLSNAIEEFVSTMDQIMEARE